MTLRTEVKSNAFNFMSFMRSDVDPRTGLYTLSIDLPELKANALSGPDLPLKLQYNPLNTVDSGFGMGWNLSLSQFTPDDSILALHTGETFKVTGSGPQPAIKEKKIDSFHFYDEGNDSYRVVHKNGLVECLKTGGSSTQRVALPEEIYGPSGHCIKLTYVGFNGGQLLSSVRDSSGELLRVVRDADYRVRFLLPPFDDKPESRFVMNFTGGRVTDIVLPTVEQASWRFTDDMIRGILCITEVETPLGGHETIEYKDTGHPFPGNSGRLNLPRVTRHCVDPGAGQPIMETGYRYTDRNFLGAGASISWADDGLDNLYKVTHEYIYGSTAVHRVDGEPVRTVDRCFNRFHLLIKEETTQNECVKTVATSYYAEDKPFEQQPAQFQLPKAIETRWALSKDPTKGRTETTFSEFDRHGNPTREVQANGIDTVYTYYPVTEEDGCPADPDGFVRNLKQTTVTPATDGHSDAATLRTQLRYSAQPPLAGAPVSPRLMATEEALFEVAADGSERSVRHTLREYFDNPADTLLHGRLASESDTLGGNTSRVDYQYSVPAGQGVLETVETLTGFDGARKVLISQNALLDGVPVLTRDDNDVEIGYVYDVLRRVIRETAAPGSEFAASRTYRYTLARLSGQRALQVETDVKGVESRTWVDGLGRSVSEERQDVDNAGGAWRETGNSAYDALGNCISQCEIDWLDETQERRLVTTFAFDDWGQPCCQTGPDGVQVHEETDPIGSTTWKGPIRRNWREGADGLRSGETVTWLNLFDKPQRVERLDVKGTSVSLHEYFYDGLGRTAEEIDGRQANTLYGYDVFDRLVSNTLPDGAEVVREYAAHSSEDLPIRISVSGKVLGEQTFDGLDRMVASTVGGRTRTFAYDPGQNQPKMVTPASGQPIAYQYQPRLGEEPWHRELPGKVGIEYVYDKENAALLRCEGQGQVLELEYFSNGELKFERREQDGETYEMEYRYSLRGRLLSYRDVLGASQRYEYDNIGRLLSTTLDTTVSRFSYDDLGRTASIETDDTASQQQVHITLEYDDFDRETLRTFDFGTLTQTLAQTWNAVDGLERRLLSEGQAVICDEAYQYDPRGRLDTYTCSGAQLPQDPYGREIISQLFVFDALNNLTRVVTESHDGSNRAAYYYENPDDPTQLSRITNNHDAYPPQILLSYDKDGNLTSDEAQRELEYDALGRLVAVRESGQPTDGSYHYDPLDRLVSLAGAEGNEQRFYRGDELANQLREDQSSTFMRGDGHLLAERQGDNGGLLLGCNASNSVLREGGAQGNALAYSVYGHRNGQGPLQSRLGFNGELHEGEAQWQLLGKGYRTYDPLLMRFRSPDSESPFGAGGVNGYAYCEGDSVNFVDPTGHATMLIVGLLAGLVSAGASVGAWQTEGMTRTALTVVAGFAGLIGGIAAVGAGVKSLGRSGGAGQRTGGPLQRKVSDTNSEFSTLRTHAKKASRQIQEGGGLPYRYEVTKRNYRAPANTNTPAGVGSHHRHQQAPKSTPNYPAGVGRNRPNVNNAPKPNNPWRTIDNIRKS